MNFNEVFGEAKWVSPGSETETPIIRTVFTTSNIISANIKISGLGFFELYLNGNKVSDDLFVPVNSHYHFTKNAIQIIENNEKLNHRIYYKTYNITSFINDGDNCISVALAPGWYSTNNRYGNVKVCWKLEMTFLDGNKKMIFSNKENSKWGQSYILKCNFLTGEYQDFRNYSSQCMLPEFDDTYWQDVIIEKVPDTNFYLQECPTDKIIRFITPKLINETDDSYIYDIGENISGWPIISCGSTKSEEIYMNVSEEITNDNELEEATNHGQNSTFITDGIPRDYHTNFTWNAFRYVSISKNAILVKCAVVHSNVCVISSFKSDDKILNWIYEAFIRTQLSNMHNGIPSDCPHLERRGYTGDGQLTCETAMLFLGAKEFYKKWIMDISDCQDEKSGHVQYTAPYTMSGGGPGGWGCAIVEVPYVYYKFYKDIEVLEEFYPKMIKYLNYLELHSEDDLVVSDQPGLWCLGDWCSPEKMLLPEPFVNTYFYAKSIIRIIDIAKKLDVNKEEINELEKLYEKKLNAIKKRYLNESTGDFFDNVQGANAFAIDLGLGDERTLKNMVSKYEGTVLYDTGVFGTDILTRVLFDKGYGDIAYSLLTSKEKYSFYNWINQGATTFWEYWTGERSHNHPMFGAVTRYLFYYILGIQISCNENNEGVLIKPFIPVQLNYISGFIYLFNEKFFVEIIRLNKNTIKFFVNLEKSENVKFEYNNQKQLLKKGENLFILKVK